MSVFVIVRLKVDATKLEQLFSERTNDFEAVGEEAREKGALHHRFVAGNGEVLIVDEWDKAESFQHFFANHAMIADFMKSAGVEGPPEVTVYRPLDSPDQF
jgi:heme-degrading monooxygenase HmoA